MLGKIWDAMKAHPYLTAGGLLGVLVIVYLSRSSGGSQRAVSTGGASATDLQLAQLQAAQGQAQLQASTAIQAAGINAGVQMAQIAANQESTDAQTAAQLEAVKQAAQVQLAAYNAQTEQTHITVGGQVAQTQAMADVIKDQYDQQTAQHQQVVDYLNNLTNAQASVANNQIDATKSIVLQEQQNKAAANAAALANLKNVGGSQNRTAIILSAQGNYQAANTAAYGQTVSSVSSDSLLARIGQASASALSTLFA